METFSKYNILADDVDRLARQDPAALVSQCDSRYTAALDGVAARVKAQRAEKHIVMLAGPSASGKTTTAHQLAARLQKIVEEGSIKKKKIKIVTSKIGNVEILASANLVGESDGQED